MVDSEKEYGHKPARWVLIVLVSGLASLVLGNELFFQITTFTRKGDQPVWHDLSQQKWDPNTATQAELELVPGMGPKLATNILEARKTKNIESLEDLGKIKGFGPQRVSLMGPWLQFPHGKKGNPEQGTNLFGASDVLKHEAKLFLIDQNIALEESLLSFTGGSPFNAIKELENKSEREVVTQLLSQGHNIDITKVNYAILTQGLDWTLNMIQKWTFDLLLNFYTQQIYYFTKEEKYIHSQVKQINLNALLLFTNELNELKKIASHPVNQELQLQNIFIKYKQIFEPS